MTDNRTGILLVDDELVDIIVVQQSLERVGHTVFVGADYDEGLATFTAHISEIDLLITDISLPGKTGVELAKVCLQQKPALRILFISGWVGAEFLQYAGIPKCDLHFLPKPFRSSALTARVERILASNEQTGQPTLITATFHAWTVA